MQGKAEHLFKEEDFQKMLALMEIMLGQHQLIGKELPGRKRDTAGGTDLGISAVPSYTKKGHERYNRYR
jgi:hypothetical protein